MRATEDQPEPVAMTWALLAAALLGASPANETFVFNASAGPVWCWPVEAERPAQGVKVAPGRWALFPVRMECGPKGADVATETEAEHFEHGRGGTCPIVEAMWRELQRR